jgi:hypothetical protein
VIILVLTIAASATACSSNQSRFICGKDFKENSVKMREGNSDRIDFDVCGVPYAITTLSVEDQKLNYQKQLRIVMRSYASSRLTELKFCPHGFTGPDSVLRPRYDFIRSFFFVDCLSHPKT